MESVELKNCSRKEKPITGGDDFSVDDLLDFSNDDVFVDDEAEMKMQRKKGVSASLNDDNTLHLENDSFAVDEDSLSLHTSELAVPMDDLAELEWLSNFVDDCSFTPCSAPPTKNKPVWLTGNRRHPAPPVTGKPPLPVNSRTKRSRTGVTGWSHLLNDSSSSSSSSSSSDTSTPQFLSGTEFLDEPTVKRQKKKKKNNKKTMTKSLEVLEISDGTQTESQTQPQRICCHCGVQKTPQWRAGPSGPKTLCNACGVRYKSGRLLPEYRPACSPTFSRELHSNSHRKVIEMRRKKMSGEGDETGLNQSVQTVEVVPSF